MGRLVSSTIEANRAASAGSAIDITPEVIPELLADKFHTHLDKEYFLRYALAMYDVYGYKTEKANKFILEAFYNRLKYSIEEVI